MGVPLAQEFFLWAEVGWCVEGSAGQGLGMRNIKECEVHLPGSLGRALRVLTPGSYLRLDESKTLLKKPKFDKIWQLVAQTIKNLLQDTWV